MININYDIFELIINKLDIDSSINLLLSSKKIYLYYKNHYKYINNIFTKKILKHLLNIDVNLNKECCLSDDKSKLLIIELFKFYKYFKLHKHSCFADYLIFIVENYSKNIDIDDISTILFEFIGSKCNSICIQDMTYICVHSNDLQLSIMMRLFYIPSCALYHTIISNSNRHNHDKIVKCIDYLFYKHYFKNFNTVDEMYFYEILKYLIKHNKITMIKYLFKKKTLYNFENLDYQLLINTCIKYEKVSVLHIIYNYSIIDKSIILINHFNITYLCEKGSFICLEWIIENMLGNMINIDGYIKSICEGLKALSIKKQNNLETFIKTLSKYLSKDNIKKIESSIIK